MSYKSPLASVVKFYHSVSTIAITTAGSLLLLAPLSAEAAQEALPTIEIHFEVLDNLMQPNTAPMAPVNAPVAIAPAGSAPIMAAPPPVNPDHVLRIQEKTYEQLKADEMKKIEEDKAAAVEAKKAEKKEAKEKAEKAKAEKPKIEKAKVEKPAVEKPAVEKPAVEKPAPAPAPVAEKKAPEPKKVAEPKKVVEKKEPKLDLKNIVENQEPDVVVKNEKKTTEKKDDKQAKKINVKQELGLEPKPAEQKKAIIDDHKDVVEKLFSDADPESLPVVHVPSTKKKPETEKAPEPAAPPVTKMKVVSLPEDDLPLIDVPKVGTAATAEPKAPAVVAQPVPDAKLPELPIPSTKDLKVDAPKIDVAAPPAPPVDAKLPAAPNPADEVAKALAEPSVKEAKDAQKTVSPVPTEPLPTIVPVVPPVGALVPAVPPVPATPPAPVAPPVPAVTPAAPAVPAVVPPVVAPAPSAALPTPPAVEDKKPDAPKPDGEMPVFTVKFISTETELPLSVSASLKDTAEKAKNGKKHVVLRAYASESADQSTTARRVSLSRVLAVRAFLIENGVDKGNIIVNAEGSKNPGGDPDRVDVFFGKVKK